MTKKVGRKKNEFPEETYKFILNSFLKNNAHTTKISYLGIAKYAQEMVDNNLTNLTIPHHYWKNGVGKQIVDDYNAILNHETSNNPSETIVSTRDIVNKLSFDSDNSKKKLIAALEMNEKKLYRYVDKNNNLENQVHNLEEELAELKQLNKSLNYKIEYYENTLFQWLELSNKREIPIMNLYTIGKTKNKYTEKFLKDIFTENPFDLFNQLSSFYQSENLDSKTIEFIKIKQEKSLLDDFDL
ncbi:hypothetical protein [Viridibacillus arvi]|uniref:hypothetical protein n=1 Tax=Viridibacillus arvi TaxID=263475 RepID=UPI003CFFF544